MRKLEKVALLIALIKKLHVKDSWCGETHIQKTVYFLQELLGVPMEFKFIMYKHGPFSFDLRSDLTEMQANRLLELEAKTPLYGSSLIVTNWGESTQRSYNNIINDYEEKLTFIADKLGNKNVIELERLATAFYITLKHPDESDDSKAERINTIKPHIPISDAKNTVKELNKIMSEVESMEP